MKRLVFSLLSLIALSTLLPGCAVYPVPVGGNIMIEGGGHSDNGRHRGHRHHRHDDDD